MKRKKVRHPRLMCQARWRLWSVRRRVPGTRLRLPYLAERSFYAPWRDMQPHRTNWIAPNRLVTKREGPPGYPPTFIGQLRYGRERMIYRWPRVVDEARWIMGIEDINKQIDAWRLYYKDRPSMLA